MPRTSSATARRPLVQLAREQHVLPVAIVLDVPPKLCMERNRERPDRAFGARVVRQQSGQLRRTVRRLGREGFRRVFVLRTPKEIDDIAIERRPLWNNKRGERGPFDIIGDVHGCARELRLLLGELGYVEANEMFVHPEGRKAVFVGDLVDRGPDSPGVLDVVMPMVEGGRCHRGPWEPRGEAPEATPGEKGAPDSRPGRDGLPVRATDGGVARASGRLHRGPRQSLCAR